MYVLFNYVWHTHIVCSCAYLLLISSFLLQVSLRISSLDYLGVVAARLRRDAVQSRLKIDTIDAIIETVREAEGEAGEEEEEDEELEEEEKRTRFLQRVLLDYLAVNGGEVGVLSQNTGTGIVYVCAT